MQERDKILLKKRAKRRLQKYKKGASSHKEGIRRAVSDIKFCKHS